MDATTTKRARRERTRRDRWRVLLTFGVILGMGSVSTVATWSDSVAGSAAQSTGRLDLLLNSQLTGQGGTVTGTGLSAPSMLPGSTAAELITVRNGGTVPFTFSATTSATGSLAPDLTWVVRQGGARSGTTCSGGTVLFSGAIGATSAVGGPTTLGPGAEASWCIQATLNPQLSVVARGRTAATSFTFSAAQS